MEKTEITNYEKKLMGHTITIILRSESVCFPGLRREYNYYQLSKTMPKIADIQKISGKYNVSRTLARKIETDIKEFKSEIDYEIHTLGRLNSIAMS